MTILRRWSPAAWVLLGITLILVLAVGDYVRRAILGPPPAPPVVQTPGPQMGGEPMDFELPDHEGKPHRLSEMRGKKFLLTFFCGCGDCTKFTQDLARTYRANKKKIPPSIAVMTAKWEPSATPAWRRIAGATDPNWTFLVSADGGKVVDEWHGTPCPKAYLINEKWKISWMSPPGSGMSQFMAVPALAGMLGMKYRPGRGDRFLRPDASAS